MIIFWELLTLGVVGGFRRAIRKQCNRDIVTKEAWCSLLCINTSICGVCSLILLQDSLACVASTCWLDHQRSHWPLQPYVTQTFTWINCSWTITSKILAQAVLLLTSDALSADSFLFSLFRLFFNSFFLLFFNAFILYLRAKSDVAKVFFLMVSNLSDSEVCFFLLQ